MQIHRLKLSGFKSFVDSTELRIEPGLTGIVGPNGCGKSNLLEAIRWVMGETSSRAMRSGGMEDVIFAGTASRPQRDFAEVAIQAQQRPGESLPAIDTGPDGEIEVIRRIERGAGSAYRANGRDVRAKDVALLFADAATGAHSPALVSQGKIAAVIAARPQERRAMLEEAAGIAGLHVRRKDAEQKLRAAETNLSRLDEIVADMETRAASLRRQARAAERYTKLSEDIRLAEARVLYVRWQDSANAASTARADAHAAQSAVDAAQEAVTLILTQVQAATAALASARAQAQSTRDSASEATHRLTAARLQIEQTHRRLSALDEQHEQLEQDRAREGSLAQDAAGAIERLLAEIAETRSRITIAQSHMPERAQRVSEMREVARDAELALAKAMAQQAREQAELRVAEAALTATRSRLERAERELARLETEHAALPEADPLQEALHTAEQAVANAAHARTAAEDTLAKGERERAEVMDQRAIAEAEEASARADLAAVVAEWEALDKSLSTTPGSANRLIDQIRVEAGYEHALAAALGEDIEAPLDPTDGAGWRDAFPQPSDPALPAGVEALAAYISAPAQLNRRLAQIGIAQSDTGQPLAVGQRLVTRQGTMRRWDGFVATEGGIAAAQRLIRRNRLDELAAKRPHLERAQAEAKAKVEQTVAAVDVANQQISDAQSELSNAQKSHAIATRQRDEATAALERLANRADDYARRIGEAQAERAQMLSEHEQAQSSLADMPDMAATQKTVAQLSSDNERALQHLAQLQTEASLAEQSLASDQNRLTVAEADVRGWRSRSGEAARRMAEMNKRAEALASERAALADQPDILTQQCAALEVETQRRDGEAASALAAERSAEAELRQCEAHQGEAAEALSSAREARAGAIARADAAEQRRTEISRQADERFECPAPVLPERLGFDPDLMQAAGVEQDTLDRLTAERERLGPVNLVAATELAELETQQETSKREGAELAQAINQLRGSIGHLNREGRSRLLTAFEAVNGHFQRLFTALFNGGEARLQLVDSDDPLEAGLEILAQPPGKRLSTLTLLSGGEQALTAIALIFALFLTNPAPICVLDEVDAPLDDANVERFCDLLDQMVRDTRTRYLIVTHNAVTMSRMHRLFGVTMVERGVSRLVSVNLGGAERLLAAE